MKKKHSVCTMCGETFELTSHRVRKFCAECLPKRQAQINRESIKNNPSRLRGLKAYAASMKGKPNPHTTGEKHHLWKGDAVGYDSLHFWVIRHKPDPGCCEHCGVIGKLEWSNISQKYLRDLDDWQRLCRSCHLKYDNKMGVRNGNKKAVYSGIL